MLILEVICSCTFQKHCKTYPLCFQFHFNGRTLGNVQIPFFKPDINSCECRLTEPTFGADTSEKFQFLVVENAFMFQMLEGTKIFTLPGKVPL